MLFSLPALVAAGCSIAPNPASPELLPDVVTPTAAAVTSEIPVERTKGGLIADSVAAVPSGGSGDGEPTDGPEPGIVPRLPSGSGPDDVAVRVALAAFSDPNWVDTIGDDLEPGFATIAVTQRHITPSSQPSGAVLVVAIEAHVDDANILFVTFDERSGGEAIRHVTAVTLTSDTDRPLVLNVTPLS